MAEQAQYSLSYRSARKEVWFWYWRMWRNKYWWWHVLMGVALAWMFTDPSPGGGMESLGFMLRFLWMTPLVVAAMAAWPQIAFKSRERLLMVGPDGWSSRIGKQQGSASWATIASIRRDGETVSIVGKSGNALLVPRRAFQSDASWDNFLSDIQRWHDAYVK